MCCCLLRNFLFFIVWFRFSFFFFFKPRAIPTFGVAINLIYSYMQSCPVKTRRHEKPGNGAAGCAVPPGGAAAPQAVLPEGGRGGRGSCRRPFPAALPCAPCLRLLPVPLACGSCPVPPRPQPAPGGPGAWPCLTPRLEQRGA